MTDTTKCTSNSHHTSLAIEDMITDNHRGGTTTIGVQPVTRGVFPLSGCVSSSGGAGTSSTSSTTTTGGRSPHTDGAKAAPVDQEDMTPTTPCSFSCSSSLVASTAPPVVVTGGSSTTSSRTKTTSSDKNHNDDQPEDHNDHDKEKEHDEDDDSNKNNNKNDSTSSRTGSSTSTSTVPARKGRRGDPRMHKAVAARLAKPHLSLLQALLEGGFTFPDLDDKKNKVSGGDNVIYDSDNILLSQRKNQLSRRLRHFSRKMRKQQEHDSYYSSFLYNNNVVGNNNGNSRTSGDISSSYLMAASSTSSTPSMTLFPSTGGAAASNRTPHVPQMLSPGVASLYSTLLLQQQPLQQQASAAKPFSLPQVYPTPHDSSLPPSSSSLQLGLFVNQPGLYLPLSNYRGNTNQLDYLSSLLRRGARTPLSCPPAAALLTSQQLQVLQESQQGVPKDKNSAHSDLRLQHAMMLYEEGKVDLRKRSLLAAGFGENEIREVTDDNHKKLRKE